MAREVARVTLSGLALSGLAIAGLLSTAVNSVAPVRSSPGAACTVPSAPDNVSASAGANKATVTWTAATGNGATITAHGGFRCQEGVLGCPGGLEVAGAAVVLAFLVAAVLWAVARTGVKLERPQR